MKAIAHRGASGTRPENTLAAFRRAVELGAPMVEIDCQLTADGELVILHDDSLDRTTNGHGLVGDRSLAEVRSLDAGSWFGPDWAGERVPTLSEAVDTILPHAELNLELKGEDRDGYLQRMSLEILRSRGFLEMTVFSSFSGSIVRRVRLLEPSARLGVLLAFGDRIDDAFSFAHRFGAEAIHPEMHVATPNLVDRAHDEGFLVRVWSVNQPADIRRFAAMGVDAIFTDFP